MHQDICTGLLTVVLVGADNPVVGTGEMNSRIYMQCNIVNDKRMRRICMCCLEKTILLSLNLFIYLAAWGLKRPCIMQDLLAEA